MAAKSASVFSDTVADAEVERQFGGHMLPVAFELRQEFLDRNVLPAIDHWIVHIPIDGVRFLRCHPHMQIRHPDIAVLGFLIPYVEHVVGSPRAGRLLQANPFANARHDNHLQPQGRLIGLVLDFDFDHAARPITQILESSMPRFSQRDIDMVLTMTSRGHSVAEQNFLAKQLILQDFSAHPDHTFVNHAQSVFVEQTTIMGENGNRTDRQAVALVH